MNPQPLLGNASTTSRAFACLNQTERAVLWNIEAERMSIDEVAAILCLSSKEVVISLTHARVRFRSRWLQVQHRNPRRASECTQILPLLVRYNRRALPQSQTRAVTAHTQSCLGCGILVEEAGHLGSHLRFALKPLATPASNTTSIH